MADAPTGAPHAAVEGPETALDDVREESHVAAGEIDALRSKLAAAEAREKELLDRAARIQADFENFRRRAREENASAAARGKEAFVRELFPVIDNVDRALAHSADEGVRLLAKHLHATLASAGLAMLDPAGEVFDAKAHEAIASERREGVKSGTVVTVVEKGYLLDGRLLRPARVIVAA